jgi:hypothetical protein
MDIVPYSILIGGSASLIFTAATVIVIINFRRLCGCCLRKEANIVSINNPVKNPVNEWK